jgi:hypothetical protein
MVQCETPPPAPKGARTFFQLLFFAPRRALVEQQLNNPSSHPLVLSLSLTPPHHLTFPVVACSISQLPSSNFHCLSPRVRNHDTNQWRETPLQPGNFPFHRKSFPLALGETGTPMLISLPVRIRWRGPSRQDRRSSL